MNCRRCSVPVVPHNQWTALSPEAKRDVRVHHGRGLCHNCRNVVRRAGELDRYPPQSQYHDWKRLLPTYLELRRAGRSRAYIAEHLGVTKSALEKAVERAARRGDSRVDYAPGRGTRPDPYGTTYAAEHRRKAKPIPTDDTALAAARTVCDRARDADDARQLLDALGIRLTGKDVAPTAWRELVLAGREARRAGSSPRPAELKTAIVEDAAFLLDTGCTAAEIARRTGATVHAVQYALDQHDPDTGLRFRAARRKDET